MELLALIILFVAIAIPIAIWRGWVLSVLWDWFIVPLGVVDIGVAWAIGISMIASYLTSEGTGDEEMGAVFARALIGPLVALGVGWILHSFFM